MKILFKVLDYFISVLMGTGTLFLVSRVVSERWNMFVAMIVGMVLGIAVLMLAVLLFVSVTTAFELVPVGMVITMFTGMITAMLITMGKADFILMLAAVVLFSLFSQFLIDLKNNKLKGDVQIEK